MIAYKITNTVNGKSYIGITTGTLAKRWREHRCAAKSGDNKPLYKAIRKYGEKAFALKCLYEADSIYELQIVEKGLIAQYGTYKLGNRGYNMTDGGEGINYVNRSRGESATASVLTEKIVAFIRDPEKVRIPNIVLVSLVQEKFGTSFKIDTLKCARNGTTWAHLNAEFPPIKHGKGGRRRPLSEEVKAQQKIVLKQHHAHAIQKSAELTRGFRAKHAKLNFEQVQDIFFYPSSLKAAAEKFGMSKKMVLLIRQKRTYTYWTKDFYHA